MPRGIATAGHRFHQVPRALPALTDLRGLQEIWVQPDPAEAALQAEPAQPDPPAQRDLSAQPDL
ncbi:MAG: hypothetical protein A3E80_05045 [Chlamydiae bacterium RIFCSPHIGHO2_12_FULL_49_9]|nr:MAG: hypothetical protein A3E80_05045 [Chlamydiae bacterium RIFCSPHIGHO2_12_FULL_49_9]